MCLCITMKRGYDWLPPIEKTLNSIKFYGAKIIDNPVMIEDGSKIDFNLDHYFPVGSIFHFLKDDVQYKIIKKYKDAHKGYVAMRCDERVLETKDVLKFQEGNLVFRIGFLHGD